MSEQTSLLRQRMIDDMSLRNMSSLTQAAYVRAVKNFSKHFCKSQAKLTFEHVREYISAQSGGSWPRTADHQPDHVCASVPPQDDARHQRCGRPYSPGAPVRPAAGDSVARRGRPLSAGASQRQAQNGIRNDLRGRPARVGGGHTHYPRHRQRSDGHPCAAGQGAQRSLRHAVGSAAQSVAVILEDRPTGTLVVSWG